MIRKAFNKDIKSHIFEDLQYDPAAIEYIEDCKKRKSLVRLCPKDALKVKQL